MPRYTVHIAYTESVVRTKTVPITAANAEEAETLVRGAFRRYMAEPSENQREDVLVIQGEDLGVLEKWDRQPVSQTFVVLAALED